MMDGAQKKEQYQKYIQELAKALQDDPQSLTETERVLGKKYMESQMQIQRLIQDRDRVAKDIDSLQMQLRQLTSKLENEVGKAGGFVEALVAMKFPEVEETNTSPHNRKERRTIAALKRAKKTQPPKKAEEPGK